MFRLENQAALLEHAQLLPLEEQHRFFQVAVHGEAFGKEGLDVEESLMRVAVMFFPGQREQLDSKEGAFRVGHHHLARGLAGRAEQSSIQGLVDFSEYLVLLLRDYLNLLEGSLFGHEAGPRCGHQETRVEHTAHL